MVLYARVLTPNQHSSILWQYYCRVQWKRLAASIWAVARNVNCWDATGRKRNL